MNDDPLENMHCLPRITLTVLLCSVLLCIVFFFAVAVRSVNTVDFVNTDFVAYWFAGKMVTAGENPYNPDLWLLAHKAAGSVWMPDDRFVYPLPTALLFAPLGLLSLSVAYLTWIVLTQCCLAGSLALLLFTGRYPRYPQLLFPTAAGVMLFRPTLLVVQNGQMSGLLLLIICGVIHLWEKGKYRLGGVLLAVLICKPNIGLPVIVLLSAWLLYRRRRVAVASCIGACLALTAIAMVYDPYWVSEFVKAGSGRLAESALHTPTVWGAAEILTGYRGMAALTVGGAAGVAILMANWVFLRHQGRSIDDRTAVCLAIILTLLLTPYVWPYDQLLLIVPVMTVMISLLRGGYPFLLAASLFIAFDVVAFVLLAASTATQTENYNAALPAAAFCLLAWQVRRARVE